MGQDWVHWNCIKCRPLIQIKKLTWQYFDSVGLQINWHAHICKTILSFMYFLTFLRIRVCNYFDLAVCHWWTTSGGGLFSISSDQHPNSKTSWKNRLAKLPSHFFICSNRAAAQVWTNMELGKDCSAICLLASVLVLVAPSTLAGETPEVPFAAFYIIQRRSRVSGCTWMDSGHWMGVLGSQGLASNICNFEVFPTQLHLLVTWGQFLLLHWIVENAADRFRLPTPPQPWSRVLNAATPPPVCIQVSPPCLMLKSGYARTGNNFPFHFAEWERKTQSFPSCRILTCKQAVW